MRHAEHTVVSAAYALADRELTRALMPRIREETVRLLDSRVPLPPPLLEELTATRDPELRTALVASAGHRDDVFQRLAGQGDPALAPGLYGEREWDRTPAQRAAVWEGAVATAGDPGWRAQDGLPAKLLASRRQELLEPALLSPFPELVAHARSVLDRRAGSDRGAGSGTRPTGPSNTTPRKNRQSWERHPRTTKELVGDLRDKDVRYTIELPATPGALDWDELVAEHRAEPFSEKGLETLWAHPNCPEELALAAFESIRNIEPGGAVHWSMLTSPAFGLLSDYRLFRLLGAGIESGALPADRVLREIGPARTILCALPPEHEGLRAALVAQVARLGTDFAPWRAVYTLLPRFSGSVTGLVDAALAETSKHLGKTWPKPAGAEFPSRRLPNSRQAWLRLYDAADRTTHRALGEHMDARAIQQLLLWHQPSPELRAYIVQLRGASFLAGIASSWDTRPEVIEELIPYNESEVNAALFLHTDLTPAQRRHVLSGRRWRDGGSADTPAADRISLTENLVDGLRESARRPWLLACADSGDPVLCRILLGSPRVKMHTPALELHMLVRLWERHGPGEVRALLDETDFPGRKRQQRHPLSPVTLEAGRAALDAEAGPDGPALLRAAYEAAASPAGRADFLSEKGAGPEEDDLAKALELLEEETGPGPVPWAELAAAHAAKPLHDRLLVRLAALDGCPAALAGESASAGLRLSHPHYRPRRGAKPPTAPEMLKKLPLRVENGGCRWLEKAHGLGQVTLGEVLRTGFPAQATIAFLSRALAPGDSPGTEEVRAARRAVAALATEHLSDDPEGWALALRLAPDFEGTLPDLLLASGAVVS
ncbi:hypothetical protein OIE71_17730 [Streptomyces sp. NBC_01725]|uniref:hypothetical protein n=1 Tax=Streptomyces sp. NBC_01725 TaxID=2975923 RepID=UPI002E2B8197|nr:hypothetical protein [Streptomyces sp. NBC_01725]